LPQHLPLLQSRLVCQLVLAVATESAERKSLCRNPPVAARYIIYEKELDSDQQEENNAIGRLALHRL